MGTSVNKRGVPIPPKLGVASRGTSERSPPYRDENAAQSDERSQSHVPNSNQLGLVQIVTNTCDGVLANRPRHCLHSVDAAAAVERLIAFYIEQHNNVMLHRAFGGQTPDEIYFNTAVNLASELAVRRRLARQRRVTSNRSMTCATCGPRAKEAVAVPGEVA